MGNKIEQQETGISGARFEQVKVHNLRRAVLMLLAGLSISGESVIAQGNKPIFTGAAIKSVKITKTEENLIKILGLLPENAVNGRATIQGDIDSLKDGMTAEEEEKITLDMDTILGAKQDSYKIVARKVKDALKESPLPPGEDCLKGLTQNPSKVRGPDLIREVGGGITITAKPGDYNFIEKARAAKPGKKTIYLDTIIPENTTLDVVLTPLNSKGEVLGDANGIKVNAVGGPLETEFPLLTKSVRILVRYNGGPKPLPVKISALTIESHKTDDALTAGK